MKLFNTKILFLAFSLLSFIYADAQKAESSWNKKTGDLLFQAFDYPQAIKRYEFIENKTIEIQRKLAQAYYYTGEFEKSESYYASIADTNAAKAEDIYNYAAVLAVNKKYEQARKQLEIYKQKSGTNIQIPAYEKLLTQSETLSIKNLKINSKHTDIPAGFYDDKLVYTSSDHGKIKRNWAMNNLPYLDLMIAETDSSGEILSKQTLFEDKAKYHRGPASFSAEGEEVFFTVNETSKNADSSKTYRLKLMQSDRTQKGWGKAEEFEFNNPEYSLGQASLSPDGNYLFFVSDKAGGLGETDIYFSEKNNNKWTKPVNLGNKVNTARKEMFPFCHSSGYLFFASQGHPGIGGLDVFMIAFRNGKLSGNAVNLRQPINSSRDDFAYILSPDESFGYFASNREGGHGNDDIYYFKIKKEPVPKILAGKITDENGNHLPNTILVLKNEAVNISDTTRTDENSEFFYKVKRNHTYDLSAEKASFYKKEKKLQINKTNDTLFVNMQLKAIPEIKIEILAVNGKTGEKIKDAKFEIRDEKSAEIISGVSENGSLSFKPSAKISETVAYKIKIEKEGFLKKSEDLSLTINDFKTYQHTIKIFPEEIGENIAEYEDVNIYFNYNRWDIKAKSKSELAKIIQILNDNPDLSIELSSHTDCRGSKENNMILSQKRADASAEYIKKHISNPERVSSKGYGESKPVNNCDCDKNPCTEEQYQANRRTEFRIVKN